MKIERLIRRHLVKAVVVIAILFTFAFTKLPVVSTAESSLMAERFSFAKFPIRPFASSGHANIRDVNPNLEAISAWISAVGAAIALTDADGDGLPNDACHVDPRNNLVTVSPLPGTGDRYAPFILDPTPLRYNSDTMAPMGCLPADMNEDGRIDYLAYYWGRTPILFVRNGESFTPIDLLSKQERWYTNAATSADLDGDGHLDLIIGNYFQDGARILDANAETPDQMQHSMSRAYNGGSTRFFLQQPSSSGPGAGVKFEEVSDVLGNNENYAWTLAIGAADLDGDLLPEIYFANDFGPDRLLHNRSTPGELRFASIVGQRQFTTPASKVLGRDSFKGMGVDFGDVNHDGILDIYVSNIAAEYALQESHFLFSSTGDTEAMQEGIAPYVDRSEPLGLSRSDWSWDSRLADFDNDGVLEALQATGFVKGKINRWPELQELAIANDELLPNSSVWFRAGPGDDVSGQAPNRFFVRASDGRYYDIADAVGLGSPHISRGIATADVDGDGDIDIAIANQWEDSYFYRNDCTQCENFLGLYLRHYISAKSERNFRVHSGRPSEPSRAAIGASVRLALPDGSYRVAQVDGGNGHSGKRSTGIHFGLGNLPDNENIDVEIRWRDSDGVTRSRFIQLVAGWHTVMLGVEDQ